MTDDLKFPRVFNPNVQEGASAQQREWLDILDRELHRL